MSSQEHSPFPTPPKSIRSGESRGNSPVTRPATVNQRQHEKELAPILDFIHKHFQSYESEQPYDQEDFVTSISIPAEEELQQEIGSSLDLSEFVARRLSYRWFPPEEQHEKGTLILRMVTALHTVVAGRLSTKIITGALTASTSPDASTKIKNAADLSILQEYFIQTEFKTSQDGKSAGRIPDAAIEHVPSGEVSLVIEIAYSEKEEDVYEKAALLLRVGKGNLKTAIAIKLRHQSPDVRARSPAGEAYYILLRWGDGVFKGRDVNVVPIRDANGVVSPGALELRLSDLCPSDVLASDDDPQADPVISISHELLNSWIEVGHARQQKADAKVKKIVGGGQGRTSPSGMNLRYPVSHAKRETTPELKRPSSDEQGRLRLNKRSKTDTYKEESSSQDRDEECPDPTPSPPEPAPSSLEQSEEKDSDGSAQEH